MIHAKSVYKQLDSVACSCGKQHSRNQLLKKLRSHPVVTCSCGATILETKPGDKQKEWLQEKVKFKARYIIPD